MSAALIDVTSRQPVPRARPPVSPKTAVRFVYDRTEATASIEHYHNHLVEAEVLMARALAAARAGLRPIHVLSSRAHEHRYFRRTPRCQCEPGSAEYVRWYDDIGSVRASPLTREALTLVLTLKGHADAVNVAHQSQALAAADQGWLEVRRSLPIELRPLNGREYHQLARAIEAAHTHPQVAGCTAPTNTDLAQQAAMTLADLLDDYHVSPFKDPVLSAVFIAAQHAHLEALAEKALENLNHIEGPLCPTLWVLARQRRAQAWRAATLSRLKQLAPSETLPVG